MKPRTPLPMRRATPRRKAPERVKHERVKPKAATRPTAEQRQFWNSLPAYCQGCTGPGECVHHLLADVPGKVGRRDHFYVVRLCHACHNRGTNSVHLLGSEAAYQRVHGTDLVAACVANVERYRGEA
jgi:hypothetical protein